MKLLNILIVIFILGACQSSQMKLASQNDDYHDQEKLVDSDRTEVIKKTENMFEGEYCFKLNESDECWEQCKEIYQRLRDAEDCQGLNTGQILAIYESFKMFEYPKLGDEINKPAFDLYLNVSTSSLEKVIKDYNKNTAERVFFWIIEDSELAEIFIKEDKDYRLISALLSEIQDFQLQDIYRPFIKNLNGERLIEHAMKADSEIILKWFHDFINEKNRACKNEPVSRDCFSVYCKIGKKIDDDSKELWLDFDFFSDYLQEIIDHRVNSQEGVDDHNNPNGWRHKDAPGRSRDQISKVRDLDRKDWVDELCDDLS